MNLNSFKTDVILSVDVFNRNKFQCLKYNEIDPGCTRLTWICDSNLNGYAD